VRRVLVPISVAAPVLVGGAALVLVAKAIIGSWLWGSAAVAGFVLVYLAVIVAIKRWAMPDPERAQASLSAWGRAIAFGSGGWEPRRKCDPTEKDSPHP
jgi:hypothetical protein